MESMANFTTPDTTDYTAIYNASTQAPTTADAGGGGDIVAALAQLGLTPADLAGASDAVLRALASQLAGSTAGVSAGTSSGGGTPIGPPSVESLAALGLTPDQMAPILKAFANPAQIVANNVISGPGEAVQWTKAAARAWWDNWFANPFPLYGINPQALPPGAANTIRNAIVLSPEEQQRARLIIAQFGPNPALVQGQSAAGTYGTANDTQKQQQASAGGPFPTPADQSSSGAATGETSAQPTGPSAFAAVQARIDAIPKLQGYIKELSGVKTPTPAQAAELTAYQKRLEEYKTTAAPPPVTSPTAPVVGLGSPPPVTTSVSGAAPKVDYSAAIAKLNQYISNLSAVKQPTPQQTAELSTYKTRLADYQSR